MRRGAWGLLIAVACEVPVEGVAGDTHGSIDDAESSAEADATIGAAADDGGTAGSSGTAADEPPSIDLGDGGTTGADDVPHCKDGVAVPGELCLHAAYAYPVAAAPRSLAIGDIDGDDVLDVVTGSNLSESVSVLRGQGDGGFAIPEAFVGSAARTSFVFLVALDDDALLDLVVVDADAQTIFAHLADGGGFVLATLTPFAFTPTAAAAADLGGDGLAEIVLVASEGTATVFTNLGLGTFGVGQTMMVGSNPRAVALGDVDHNGWIDIVTANEGGNSARVVYNHGFVFTPAIDPLSAQMRPRAVALGDLDGDAWIDIALANFDSDSLTVRLAAPMAGFVDDAIVIPVGNEPSSLLAADFDADGILDLAVAQQGNLDAVGIHRGRGDGTFDEPARYPVGDEPLGLAAADLDRDGALDLLVTNVQSDDLFVLLSDP